MGNFFYPPFQRKRRIIVETKYPSSNNGNPIDHSLYVNRQEKFSWEATPRFL